MDNLFPVIDELLKNRASVNLTVTGNSMFPFLRDCRDSVLLESPDVNKPENRKIVLIRRPDGVFILHRIVWLKDGSFRLLGDAQTVCEGPFGTDRIIAVVKEIRRANRSICTKSPSWRLLSFLWYLLLPFRKPLLQFIFKLSAIKNTLFRYSTNT